MTQVTNHITFLMVGLYCGGGDTSVPLARANPQALDAYQLLSMYIFVCVDVLKYGAFVFGNYSGDMDR